MAFFSGTYPLIYGNPWSFYMRIHYMQAYFWSPYLSHKTRSTCTDKPVYNDHPRDPKIVAIVDRWSILRGRFMLCTLKYEPKNSGRCWKAIRRWSLAQVWLKFYWWSSSISPFSYNCTLFSVYQLSQQPVTSFIACVSEILTSLTRYLIIGLSQWFPTRMLRHIRLPWGGARGAAKYWKKTYNCMQ